MPARQGPQSSLAGNKKLVWVVTPRPVPGEPTPAPTVPGSTGLVAVPGAPCRGTVSGIADALTMMNRGRPVIAVPDQGICPLTWICALSVPKQIHDLPCNPRAPSIAQCPASLLPEHERNTPVARPNDPLDVASFAGAGWAAGSVGHRHLDAVGHGRVEIADRAAAFTVKLPQDSARVRAHPAAPVGDLHGNGRSTGGVPGWGSRRPSGSVNERGVTTQRRTPPRARKGSGRPTIQDTRAWW